MDNFDLRKYLAEGKLNEDKPVWTIEGEDDSPTIESSDKGYKEAVVSYIKSIHPNISDKDLKKSMEVAEETWYNEGRENAKSGEGEDFDVSVEEFADGAVEYYEDVNDIEEGKLNENEMDNFDLRKYLAEGRLLKEEEIDVLGNEFLQDIQSEMKRMYSMDVDMDDIKDWVQMYYIGYNSEYDEGPGDVDYEGNEFGSEDFESEKKELVFDTGEREDFYTYIEDYLAEGKLQENKYDIDDPNSPLGKLNDDYESSGLKGIIDKYGLDVVLMMLSSGEYGERKSTSSGIEYTSEGKLKTKENQMSETKLTPLQKYIFDYESDISNDVDMKAIKGLKNADDVYDYYAYERGWEDDKDLEDDLNNIYSQVKNKFN